MKQYSEIKLKNKMKLCIHNTDVAIELHEDSECEAEAGQNVLADINPEHVDLGIDVQEFASELVRRWNSF